MLCARGRVRGERPPPILARAPQGVRAFIFLSTLSVRRNCLTPGTGFGTVRRTDRWTNDCFLTRDTPRLPGQQRVSAHDDQRFRRLDDSRRLWGQIASGGGIAVHPGGLFREPFQSFGFHHDLGGASEENTDTGPSGRWPRLLGKNSAPPANRQGFFQRGLDRTETRDGRDQSTRANAGSAGRR